MSREEDSSDLDESVPLANLADRIAHKHTIDQRESDHVWERLDWIDDPDENDLWELLSSPTDDESIDHDPGRIVISAPIVEDNRRKVGGLSPFGQVLHGYFTSMILLVALLIAATAAIGIIDARYGVLSLPFFAIGTILLIPILAWELDYWDPREIG